MNTERKGNGMHNQATAARSTDSWRRHADREHWGRLNGLAESTVRVEILVHEGPWSTAAEEAQRIVQSCAGHVWWSNNVAAFRVTAEDGEVLDASHATWPPSDGQPAATCRDEGCLSHGWEGGRLVHYR